MKNKNLIISIVTVAVILGVIFIAKPFAEKKVAKKAAPARKVEKLSTVAKKPPAVPGKRAISKDKGGLTVKVMDSKKRELPLRVRAFRSVDAKSSVYQTAFFTNRMQELSPGTYDIEIGTIPQKIYKNIKVVNGKENVEDLGFITGSLIVKVLNHKKEEANYPLRILYSKTNDMVVTATTNRPVEIMPGVYDIEVGTLPRQVKKDIRIEAGKEAALDLGSIAGFIIVKAVDENQKEVRLAARITKSDTNELVTSITTNRPIEILEGTYNVEVYSTPKQDKKGVKVNAGEETSIDFLVQAPPAPPAPPKPAPPKAVKM